MKKLKTVEVERIAVQRESETIRSQAASLNREIDIEVKETLSAKTQAAEVRAELEELNEALDKAADSTQRQVAIAKLNQKMIKDLEAEISAFKRYECGTRTTHATPRQAIHTTPSHAMHTQHAKPRHAIHTTRHAKPSPCAIALSLSTTHPRISDTLLLSVLLPAHPPPHHAASR